MRDFYEKPATLTIFNAWGGVILFLISTFDGRANGFTIPYNRGKNSSRIYLKPIKVIMRCKNCGWPNKPGETTCAKCHSPLVSDELPPTLPARGDVEELSTSRSGGGNFPLKKTVREDEVFGGGRVLENVEGRAQGDESTCPKCGYPIRAGVDKCPNCKYEINRSVESARRSSSNSWEDEHDNRRSSRQPTRLGNGTKGGGKYRGTINPYMMNIEAEPYFTLKPQKRINERHELDEIEYEGKEVILTRDNTEENNPSITSRQQAVVTRIDGHWFIEDKSEQKTTFVQAASKIELHDGDLILLGNRLFEFHE